MAETQPNKFIEIRPQPGPQEQFLSSPCDIVIYGGGAGGGKSFGLLLEPLRHVGNKGFGGVIFRRTSPQIRYEGGLWDESEKLYPLLGATPKETTLEWMFPSGAKMKFAHMQYESDKLDWQGSQIAYIGWDELTHFEESQFWYLLSRNRSTCGVRPYIRATCNPDADSWVARLLSWWIDPDTGYTIKERLGVARWFVRVGGELIWADDPAELAKYVDPQGNPIPPKSLTFIEASVYDNKILLEKDPAYLANLMALPHVDRARLLDRNWKIRKVSGSIFKLHWFKSIAAVPYDEVEGCVRYWDLGGSDSPKADYTVGARMWRLKDGRIIIDDVIRGQWSKLERNKQITTAIKKDSELCDSLRRPLQSYLEQVPGIAVEVIDNIITECAPYSMRRDFPKGTKASRADRLSAYTEAGKLYLLENAPWVNDFTAELCAFSEDEKEYAHDDQVDGASGCYNTLFAPPVYQPQYRIS